MVTVEMLKKEEIPALLELYKALVPHDLSLEKAERTYDEMRANSEYLLLAAKKDGELLGSMLGICCQSLTMPFLVVEDVIVKDGVREKGIGRKLMEALDEFAKSRNCAYAILVSSAFRTGAHQFYEKVGYTDSVVGFRKLYEE